MAFDSDRVTGDAGSNRPVGGGYTSIAFDITNDAGTSGGDIETPFTEEANIEIAGWTPSNFPSAVPAIIDTSINSNNRVVVTVETDIDADGRLRLVGRGGS